MSSDIPGGPGRSSRNLVSIATPLLLLTTILPLALGGALAVAWQYRTITERATTDLEQLADAQLALVRMVLVQPLGSAHQIASRTQLRVDMAAILDGADPDQTMAPRILIDARNAVEQITTVTITDPSGAPLVSTDAALRDPIALVSDLVTSDPDATAVFLGRRDTALTWQVAVPMYDSGRVLGAAVLELDPAPLLDALEPTRGDAGAVASACLYVPDGSGGAIAVIGALERDCLATSQPDLDRSNRSDETAPSAAVLRGEARTIRDTATPSGERTIAVTRPLPEYSWGLVVWTPRAELLAPARQATAALVGLLGLASGGAALVAVLVAGRVSRPLRRLQAVARRIEEGELDVVTDETRQDDPAELRDLADSMERMAVALAASHRAQEERYADLEVLAHAMAHDLKGPLTASKGLLELLVHDRVTEEADRRLLMERSLAASERMQRLLDDLLVLLRAIGGPVRRDPVHLEPVIDEAIASLELSDQVHRGPLPTVEGDPTLLGQVFLNLLHNAATYHRPGHPPRIEVGAETDEDGTVAVHVDDGGVGIPAEDRERMLDTFARGSNIAVGGTGLGLPIAARIVERHGGRLTLADAPLGGLRVRVVLPAADAPSV